MFLASGIHLMLTLQAAVDTFEIMMPTRETRCADCKRVIGQGQGKSTDDGVSRSLLRPDYGSEDDGDFNA